MTDDKKPGIVAGIKDALKKVRNFGRSAIDAFAKFKPDDSTEIDFSVDFGSDTIWATQDQIAAVFQKDKSGIAKHIKAIIDEGELNEDQVMEKFATTGPDGKTYQVAHYNLDMILSVGYRTNGPRATAFRKWASTVLKGFIEDGYALNGKRLNSDPAALLKLAQTVRSIRTSEKNLYSQVRETFKECAIDYDTKSNTARTFFATSQDVFHYAASEKTAIEIIMSRADATKPNMGMTTVGNKMPTAADVTVAKNYCTEAELRKMELIGEAWLLYAEGMAMQNKQVSQQRLLDKLTDLVATHEFPVFPGYRRGGPSRDAANDHAKAQLQLFKKTGNELPAVGFNR
ncbi:virulence RhuM family protein [Devosia sp. BK]|uniref:RhuM family protein n=1 Tax=Devosia sp. BK TaxID=2871706 RepID=UPI00293A7D55|nr:RhuM family protein [Devosia sp. BK]MDV3253559.1 virulence RhuM family protein [Devosia sp. BK]